MREDNLSCSYSNSPGIPGLSHRKGGETETGTNLPIKVRGTEMAASAIFLPVAVPWQQ